MDVKIVVRRSVGAKNPTWYFYTGSKYLGCLFLMDECEDDMVQIMLGRGEHLVEWVNGPEFTQDPSKS